MTKLSENKKFYMVILISFLIMIFVGRIPPFGAMTPYGMQLLGVFAGCIFGWLFSVIIPVSLMAIVVTGLVVSGQTVDSVMTSVQSLNMVLVVFWAFLFVYALDKCGLLEFITNKIMGIKLCSKSPWHVAVAIWICTMICAGLSATSFASAILMFSVWYHVADKIGAQKASAYTSFVMIGIAGIAMISIGMVPYASNIFLSLSFMSAVVPDVSYNVLSICAVNFCVVLFVIILMALILKIFMKTNIIKVEFEMEKEGSVYDKKAELNTKVKWGFFYIVLLVALMLVPTFLPEGSAIKAFLGRIGTLGMFVVVVTLMCLTSVKGERLLDLEQAFKEGAVKWQVYFMMGTALAVSGLLMTDDAGLSQTIQDAMGSMVEGMSIYVLCLVFIVIGLALTNCITNSVAMQLIIPVLAIFTASKGVNPSTIAGLTGIILVFGLILPSGSPLGAFIHGLVEWIEPKKCYVYTIVMAICVVLSVAIVGIPLALTLTPAM